MDSGCGKYTTNLNQHSLISWVLHAKLQIHMYFVCQVIYFPNYIILCIHNNMIFT